MNIIITYEKEEIQSVIRFLQSMDLEQKDNPHGRSFRANDAVITVYNTGKVMIQGKESKLWEEQLLNCTSSNTPLGVLSDKVSPTNKNDILSNLPCPRVGSDESGKGDFFGPLVTVAYFLPSMEVQNELEFLGVVDSKKISDKKILELAPKIRTLGIHQVVRIGPAKYNELYTRMQNINKILGWSHSRAIENILVNNSCSLAVADQFGDESIISKALFEKGRQIKLIQTHKAERDIAVAAASILAREAFLESIHQLELRTRHKLPLGAGEQVITAGIEIAAERGIDYLKEIAKNHFKTFKLIEKRL